MKRTCGGCGLTTYHGALRCPSCLKPYRGRKPKALTKPKRKAKVKR